MWTVIRAGQFFQQRSGVADGCAEVGCDIGERVHGVEVRVPRLGGEQARTADGHGGNVVPGSCRQHPCGRLSLEALVVQSTFAGNDQVGSCQVRFEIQHLQHELDARAGGGAEHCQGGETDAAGCAGSGRVCGLG